MEMSQQARKFFEEVARQIDSSVNTTLQWIRGEGNPELALVPEHYKLLRPLLSTPESQEALYGVMKELCYGLLHSVFAAIDGATALADQGVHIELVDVETKQPVCSYALHEAFFEVLGDLGDPILLGK